MDDSELKEIGDQLQEYKENILTTLEQDHETAELPHYGQVTMMLSHYAQLTDHLVAKAGDQVTHVAELSEVKLEFEQKLLDSLNH